jgi:hypothetical protein
MTGHATRTLTRVLAGATAAAVAFTPVSAMAFAPDGPLEPRGTAYSVGQSVQIRTDANGVPNSDVINFRWSVTQISAQGEGETFTAEVPEDGELLRSLQDFSNPPQENGYATYEIPLEDGFGTARSVSLYPPDSDDIPVDIRAEFTLDGEPVEAQDIVGKDGVVTATYTVTNKTRKKTVVPITSVTGDEIEKEVEADVPMVVEAQTFLPDRFAALNTGTGLGGADGRGNVQVKWIALPFAPLSADGSAQFGWAANVRDGYIPDMLVQVLPLYIPEGEAGDEDEPDADDVVQAGLKLGVPPPDVSTEAAQIAAGLEDVVGGLEKLTSGGGDDPLQGVEDALNNFFQEFGTNIQNIADILDPENPEGFTVLLRQVQAQLDEINAVLAELSTYLTPERLDQVGFLAENWNDIVKLVNELNAVLPDLIALLETGVLPIDCSAPDPNNPPSDPKLIGVGELNKIIIGGNYQGHLDKRGDLPSNPSVNDSYTYSPRNLSGITAGATIWTTPDGEEEAEWVDGGLPSEPTACRTTLAVAAELIKGDETAQALLAQLKAAQPIIEELAKSPVFDPDNADQIAASLEFISRQLSGIVTVLVPLTAEFSKVVDSLASSLEELQEQVAIIAQGLLDQEVDLPALDEVLASVVESILQSPGGQQLTSGLDQVSGGIGGVKSELSTWAASLAVALQTASAAAKDAIDNGKDTAAALIDQVDTLKASVGGLVVAAHQSPLPYGGDPTQAPEGTKLAGAYEFRMDPADYEQPSTLPRIIIAVILLLIGGFIGNWAATRRPPASPTSGAVASGPGGSGPVPEGWAPWGAAAAGAATATTAMPAVGAEEPPAGGSPGEGQQPGS